MQEIITSLSKETLADIVRYAVRQELKFMSEHSPTQTLSEEPVKIDVIAKMLDVSDATVHSYKRKGMIPYHKIGRRTFFYKNEVLDSLKQIRK